MQARGTYRVPVSRAITSAPSYVMTYPHLEDMQYSKQVSAARACFCHMAAHLAHVLGAERAADSPIRCTASIKRRPLRSAPAQPIISTRRGRRRRPSRVCPNAADALNSSLPPLCTNHGIFPSSIFCLFHTFRGERGL